MVRNGIHLLNRAAIICAMLVAVSACQMRNENARVSHASPLWQGSRSVEASYVSPYEPIKCVFVVVPDGKRLDPVSIEIHDRLSVMLNQRIPKTINPQHVSQISRRMAVDPNTTSGELLIADATDCPYVARSTYQDLSYFYALVWGHAAATIHLSLSRAGNPAPLWESRQTVSRSNGGVPMTPVGVVTSAFQATMMFTEQDVGASIIDDALRQAIDELPDFRHMSPYGAG